MKTASNSRVLRTIPLLIVFCLVSMPAQAQYGGGTGESNDPYMIYTAEQMNEIGLHEEDWRKDFKLMADIDLSSFTGTEFNSIGYIEYDVGGYSIKPFTGVFNGNGHTISNFSYTSTDRDHVGLFGYVEGTIKDLGLIDPNVDAGIGDRVGSLVGYNFGTITNCYVEGGSVTGDNNVGGLVGNGGPISNCYAFGDVTGTGWSVGGLVGRNFDPITNCYSTGSVTGDNRVGGLVGWNSNGTIKKCYSVGSVVGTTDVGGLVGLNSRTIANSFWDTQTSGRYNMCGSQDPEGSGCNNGNGKTTAEMQTATTFLEAGWNFVDETENGIHDIWWILEGQDYPRLWWEPIPEN